MNWLFWKRERVRLEPGPMEVLQAVRAEFVGDCRVIEHRYTGLTHDSVHRVTIEKLIAVEPILDRHIPLRGVGSRVLRFGDLELRLEMDGEQTKERLRDIVVPECHRHPRTGRVTGILIADQIVPKPSEPPVGTEIPGEVEQAQGEERSTDAPTSALRLPSPVDGAGETGTSNHQREENEEPALRLDAHVPAQNPPNATEDIQVLSGDYQSPPRTGMRSKESALSAQPFASGPDASAAKPSAYLPYVILDGLSVTPHRDDSMCLAGVVVRAATTGLRLDGMVQVTDHSGLPLLAHGIPRSFRQGGFSVMGPPGEVVLIVEVAGYRKAIVPMMLEPSGARTQEVFLQTADGNQLVYRARLTHSDALANLHLHLVHSGADGTTYHISRDNPGALDRWPYAALSEDPADPQASLLEISRVTVGASYCLVHDFTNRDNADARALVGINAQVDLMDGLGRLIATCQPPAETGNLWCAFVLINGEPLVGPSGLGSRQGVDVDAVQRWRQDSAVQERLQRSESRSRATETRASLSQTRKQDGDWWFLICALVGLSLTLFVANVGTTVGATVMALVTLASLYYVHLGGHPVVPPSFLRSAVTLQQKMRAQTRRLGTRTRRVLDRDDR